MVHGQTVRIRGASAVNLVPTGLCQIVFVVACDSTHQVVGEVTAVAAQLQLAHAAVVAIVGDVREAMLRLDAAVAAQVDVVAGAEVELSLRAA